MLFWYQTTTRLMLRHFFQELCGVNDMSHGFVNPDFPDKTVFVIFDTVHILKCIRNNWLNQTDSAHTFTYPSPRPISCKPSAPDLTVSKTQTKQLTIQFTASASVPTTTIAASSHACCHERLYTWNTVWVNTTSALSALTALSAPSATN